MFVDLIYRMLAYDAEDRIKPEEALNHPFILYGGIEVIHSNDEGRDMSYPQPPVNTNECKKSFNDEVKHPWCKRRIALYMAAIATALVITFLAVAMVAGGGIAKVIFGPTDNTTSSGYTTGEDNQDRGITSPKLTKPSAENIPESYGVPYSVPYSLREN